MVFEASVKAIRKACTTTPIAPAVAATEGASTYAPCAIAIAAEKVVALGPEISSANIGIRVAVTPPEATIVVRPITIIVIDAISSHVNGAFLQAGLASQCLTKRKPALSFPSGSVPFSGSSFTNTYA